MDRRLVQPASAAFDSGLLVPHQLREETDAHRKAGGLGPKLSTKAGQAQTLFNDYTNGIRMRGDGQNTIRSDRPVISSHRTASYRGDGSGEPVYMPVADHLDRRCPKGRLHKAAQHMA